MYNWVYYQSLCISTTYLSEVLLADVCLESLVVIFIAFVVSLQARTIVFLLLSSPAAGAECQGFAEQRARGEKWGRIWAAACFPSVAVPPGIRWILSLSIPPVNSFHSFSNLRVFLFPGWDQTPNVLMHCPTRRVKVPTLHVCTVKHGLENRNADGLGFYF